MWKARLCDMTKMSGARDSSDYDRNTILLECGETNIEFIFISGFKIINFTTEDQIIEFYTSHG